MNSSKTPPKKLVGDFKTLRETRDEANRLVINVTSHPEATQEQILRARDSGLRIGARYKEIRADLREIYPNQSYWRTYPWNDKEES
jgi:hypothetical protein